MTDQVDAKLFDAVLSGTVARDERVDDQMVYVYPGSFSPPTYGHRHLVERAARVFPKLSIVCSVNPNKTEVLFDAADAKRLWGSYRLPSGVTVITLKELQARLLPPERLVMIRGLRGEVDAEDEKRVMLYNHQNFGISQFFNVITEPCWANHSSTLARQAAQALDFNELARLVAPRIVSEMLERSLGIKRLFLVVGRTGSGKSVFLKEVTRLDATCIHVDTDAISRALRPWLVRQFPGQDLNEMARENPGAIQRAFAPRWLEGVRSELIKEASAQRNIFLEVPYALRSQYKLHKMFGGRVVYVGCGDAAENARRVAERGTPEHQEFIETIPDLAESTTIARDERLDFYTVDTSGPLSDLPAVAAKFLAEINS